MLSLLFAVALLVQALPKARRYVDNGDETISDLVTGLMWQRVMEAMTWNQAVNAANAATTAGYTDWRLPNMKELYSLILYSGSCSGDDSVKLFIDYDYFDQPLGDTSNGGREIDAQTWSSTDYDGYTMGNTVDTVMGVNFVDGRVKSYPKVLDKYARLVRGNEDYGVNIFTNNGDGTVSDSATGLMWAESDSGGAYDWENALAYAEDSTLSGYTDWRLPTMKELNSIVDYSKSQYEAFIDETYFQITQTTDPLGDSWYAFYWSSTTLLEGPGDRANYQTFGRALANYSAELIDAHGAGAVRGDPKSGDAADYPMYYNGYQGDLQYVYNYVRIVRDISETDTDLTYPIVETNVTACYNDKRQMICPTVGGAYYGQDGNYESVEYIITDAPTQEPTFAPTTTASPTYEGETNTPTLMPTLRPPTLMPTLRPSLDPTNSPTQEAPTGDSEATGVFEQPAFYIAAVVIILLLLICFICRARICGTKSSSVTHKNVAPGLSQSELQQRDPKGKQANDGNAPPGSRGNAQGQPRKHSPVRSGSRDYQPQVDRRGYNVEGPQVEGEQNYGVTGGGTNVSRMVDKHDNRLRLGEPTVPTTNTATGTMKITRV